MARRSAEGAAGRPGDGRPYMARLWAELGRRSGEHDALVKAIIVERLVKSAVLVVLAVSLLIAGENGSITAWARYAQDQLNLNVGHGLITRLLLEALVRLGRFNHLMLAAVAALIYAALESTEGVGLALRRRWAEYLTVIATGILIPYEVYEVFHRVTLFKVGALLVNLAVVGYLAYRKRLFVGV